MTLIVGCNRGAPESNIATDGGSDTGDSGTRPAVPLLAYRDVDVLFVIDDSENMSEVQRRLAVAMDAFVDVFDEENGTINLRIAFTSTDDGHYWCDEKESDVGQFIASSCRERLEGFTSEDSDLEAESACTEVCPYETIELQPTPIGRDTTLSARPWIERLNGVSNLPDGVSLADAARCFAPLGIRGCRFESHLNSMWKALELSKHEEQAQYGFLRDEALLAVVFVTNEAECSSTRDLQPVTFGLEGPDTRVFWTLPDQQDYPPSAVCWNAGVECDLALDSDQCLAVDKAVDGTRLPLDTAGDPAMVPLSTYVDFVQRLEDDKTKIIPGREIFVAGIVGVAPDFVDTGELVYAPDPSASDPDSFGARFGIGPGCSSKVVEAVPPVRLRQVAERFTIERDAPQLFSVCDEDYAPALTSIAESIRGQLQPSCVPLCVADGNPESAGLQPVCTVHLSYFDGEGLATEDIPECGGVRGTPAGREVCYQSVTEEMDARCEEQGWNLEVRIVYPPGRPATPGTLTHVECVPSDDTSLDCPKLPY